jgi:hypothetical protein
MQNMRTIQLVFIGPKDSDKTSLWHDILGIRHEQEDSKRSILNKFSLKLQDGKWNVTGTVLHHAFHAVGPQGE